MLPNAEKAVIDPAKIRDYLLSPVHPVGRFKAVVFQALGYTAEGWEQLRDDILCFVSGSEIFTTVETAWGLRFKIRSQWQGANSRSLSVITIWQEDRESEVLRFVTLYPDKSIEGHSRLV